MLKFWVANTDNDWFDFLSYQRKVDEINFWQPSGSGEFKAIEEGDLFVFRLKSPRNVIGGFGIFAGSSILPISLAWDAFGIKNGVDSYDEMRRRISRYRKDADPRRDYFIGCRIVVNPVFLPEELWLPQPRSWFKPIVVGKGFDASQGEGLEIWQALQDAQMKLPAQSQNSLNFVRDNAAVYRHSGNRFGDPIKVVPRLGQGAFRVAVIEAYERQCALSGARVLPALDAAHIRAFSEGGEHSLSNGLLLRKDIHGIFDAGYATIDDDFRLVISRRVKEDFNNGHDYLKMSGSKIRMPVREESQPSIENIRWHQDNVFVD